MEERLAAFLPSTVGYHFRGTRKPSSTSRVIQEFMPVGTLGKVEGGNVSDYPRTIDGNHRATADKAPHTLSITLLVLTFHPGAQIQRHRLCAKDHHASLF